MVHDQMENGLSPATAEREFVLAMVSCPSSQAGGGTVQNAVCKTARPLSVLWDPVQHGAPGTGTLQGHARVAVLAKSSRWAEEVRLADVQASAVGVRSPVPSDRTWLGQDGEQVIVNTSRYPSASVRGRKRMMRDAASSDILAVWKRAVPRNRMREILTSGSVGGLVEQSLILPGPGPTAGRNSCSPQQWNPPEAV
jgi:hypothetical protein